MKSELITGISGGLLAVVILAGCAPTTPRLDQQFGESANMAKARQTINPDASKNTDPVAGIDGQAANSIIDRYHQAYEAPTPAPTGAIGVIVGGGTTLK